MRRIFLGFCRNWFLIDPFHYLSSRSTFGFEFAEIFKIEKLLLDSVSRGIAMVSRGVAMVSLGVAMVSRGVAI
jgi:hypothetical protein